LPIILPEERGTSFNNSLALETLWKTLSSQSLTVFILFWGWLWEIGLDREFAVSGAWKSMPNSLLPWRWGRLGDPGNLDRFVLLDRFLPFGGEDGLEARGEMQLTNGLGEAQVGDVCLA